MAIALAQGGSGFPFFAPCVFKYMSGVKPSEIVMTLPEVPFVEVRTVLDKVLIKQ